MSTAGGVIRTILWVDIVTMALLSLIYLRQRRMSWAAFICWGVLAMFVPVLGPFLVISNRPGEWDPTFSFSDTFKGLVQLVQRILPGPPPVKKISRLDRVRQRRKKKL